MDRDSAPASRLRRRFPDEGWEKLACEFERDYMHTLSEFLDGCRNICPEERAIFRAYQLTSLQDVRVVIVGQDPYPDRSQAMGLAFSVPAGLRPHPLSLRNIFHELQSDLEIDPHRDGDLTRWATQGVLLLNRTLTVGAGAPGSHRKGWWTKFTRETVNAIIAEPQPVAFVLWGRDAQELARGVSDPHCVFRGAHPSRGQAPRPGEDFNPDRHFFGGRYFSRANEFLVANDRDVVDW